MWSYNQHRAIRKAKRSYYPRSALKIFLGYIEYTVEVLKHTRFDINCHLLMVQQATVNEG